MPVISLAIVSLTVVPWRIFPRSEFPGVVANVTIIPRVSIISVTAVFLRIPGRKIPGLRVSGLLAREWLLSAIFDFVFPITLVNLHCQVLELYETGRTGDGLHDLFDPERERSI